MSRDRAHSAWKSAESIKKLSDRIVGIGPFSIGLDGILTWIPGAGIVYSAGAAAYLLWLAFRAGASFGTLMRMSGALGLDLLVSDFPIPGVADLFDVLWQGHLIAANSLQKDIEGRHGIPPDRIAMVEKALRRRGRGLGWIVLLLVVGLVAAIWRSDFGETLHRGWWPAFKDASLLLAGYSISLPLVAGVLLVLIVLINAANRPRRA
ncbi:MAG: DUF4112 domain-containing protein [Caulobacter sp.]|nr:DUF4112 domain-containing protein [Caulobacter sp.]